MKILKCRKCGEEIYPDEERCSHCGASLKWLRNLAPCRDCGELVSKTASRCPYCGVRYPNKIWFATQLVSAIVLFFCGCYCINILLDTLIPTETTYPSTSEPSYQYSEPEHKPIEISAEQLWREFKYDRTYANKSLDNKIIAVTGIVVEQTENFMLHPCVLLENGEDSIPDGIFIMFPEGFDVFQYHLGEEITIVGRCSPAIHIAGDDTNPTIFVYVED